MGVKVGKVVFQGEMGFGRNGWAVDKQKVQWGAAKKVKASELINAKAIREQLSPFRRSKINLRKAKHHDWWMTANESADQLLTDNKTANHNLYYLNLFFYNKSWESIQ